MKVKDQLWLRCRRSLRAAIAATTMLSVIAMPAMPALAGTTSGGAPTTTPIKHIIIIIGENRTFDHVFATYTPKAGQTVRNLLSEGIVNADGSPGPNFNKAAQYLGHVTKSYSIAPATKTLYHYIPPAMTDGAPSTASDSNPPPFATTAAVAAFEGQAHDGLPIADYKLLTTGETGLPSKSVDTRVANATKLPSGPYQLTGPNLPYDSYTSSPVHRFYQMWEETDCSAAHITSWNPSGCLNDLFPWVETSIGAGSNGQPQPPNFTDQTTGEGSTSMAFFNVAKGDAPVLKRLADNYTLSDNFHQSIEGGTGANHIALGTGLAIYYSDGQGHVATPPADEIENPNPQAGTNNYYTQDGYSGGSYSDCSDSTQPGVGPVLSYLRSLPSHPKSKCAAGAYYLLNNYNPGYYGDGTVNTTTFTIPPSAVPTIGDVLNARGISWAYFGAGWDNYVKDPNSDLGGLYCNICNPFLYETSIMTSATQRARHLKDMPDLISDIAQSTLPAVSFVKPDGLLDGHPASSKLDLFEALTQNIINRVKANATLWKSTAILITFDEGGGYWDSGYIQPLDFFGDGTRIPAIMVSAYSAGGRVSHVYADHVSFLKFVERNWALPTVSKTGRDNLPDPIAYENNPYVPVNSPAIGDLMDMFDFTRPPAL
ncbi:MAG TPA: alkaline phosphatase family protein [Acetobacteraceae bacterium]|nr:alkaline phosphatase family protein [Acetobacteraceae bacterium]